MNHSKTKCPVILVILAVLLACAMPILLRRFFFPMIGLEAGGGSPGMWVTVGAEILMGLIMLLFLCTISGFRAFRFGLKGTGSAFLLFLPLYIIMGLFSVINVVAQLTKGDVIPNWPVALLQTALLCAGVGLFEECAFRAILQDGLVAQFRNRKHIFAVVAILTFLLFGVAHVVADTGTAFAGPIAAATYLAKILQTGVVGVLLLMLYWKTQNIVPSMIAHALFDFILMAPSAISGGGLGAAYVADGAEGLRSVIVTGTYTVITAIILLVYWLRKIRHLDYDKLREEW